MIFNIGNEVILEIKADAFKGYPDNGDWMHVKKPEVHSSYLPLK